MIELHDAHVTEYGNHLLEHIDDGRWDKRVDDLARQCRLAEAIKAYQHPYWSTQSAQKLAELYWGNSSQTPPIVLFYQRKDVLLKAAYDLLAQCYKSEGQYAHSGERYKRYVPDPMATTVRYDDADCDGVCLLNDIAYELDLPDSLGL